jgi:molecular chaperone GrpE
MDSILEQRLKEAEKVNKLNVMNINMLQEELKNNSILLNDQTIELDVLRAWQSNALNNLITIFDDFENVYKFAIESKNEALLRNTTSIFSTIKKRMLSLGIEEIDPVGERFNPEFHECLSAVDSAEVDTHIILETVIKGYRFQGKVLRIAKVIVAR